METMELRNRVIELASQLGATVCEPESEAILIRDGHYCGRHFQFNGLLAVWYTGNPDVAFYHEDGSPLATLPLSAGEAITLSASEAISPSDSQSDLSQYVDEDTSLGVGDTVSLKEHAAAELDREESSERPSASESQEAA